METSAHYSKTVPIGQCKKDLNFVSISKAWDKLTKLMQSKKLIFDSAAHGWMRFKHPNKNKYVQLSGSSKLINSGKPDEDFLETLTIHFYSY